MADDNYNDLMTQDIFTLMGFQNLSEEKRKELTEKMMETIYARVMVRVESELNEEDRNAWLKLIDEDKKDETKQFLIERNLDVDKMMAEEALVYKLEMVKSAEMIKKQSQETPRGEQNG